MKGWTRGCGVARESEALEGTVRGTRGVQRRAGRGKLGPGLLGSEDAGGSFRDPEGTGMGTVSEPQFLDPSGDLAPEFGDLERGWSGEAGTLGSK